MFWFGTQTKISTKLKDGLWRGNYLFPSRSILSGNLIGYDFFRCILPMAVTGIREILIIWYCVIFIIFFHAAPSFQRQYVQNYENYNQPGIDLPGKKYIISEHIFCNTKMVEDAQHLLPSVRAILFSGQLDYSTYLNKAQGGKCNHDKKRIV